MTGANFKFANLQDAIFTRADTRGADFEKADTRGAVDLFGPEESDKR
jgi:uncharacterized protein YjbI with pentapeptide repeats